LERSFAEDEHAQRAVFRELAHRPSGHRSAPGEVHRERQRGRLVIRRRATTRERERREQEAPPHGADPTTHDRRHAFASRGTQPRVEGHGDLVRRAIAREPEAVRSLVSLLRPTIQMRVARALMRRVRKTRNASQEVEDLVQEVFLALFDDDARALRAWDSSRPLEPFVAVVADHEVASILRSGRRRPWRDEHDGEVDVDTFTASSSGPESIVGTTELYAGILELMRAELTPKGLELFQTLIVEEQPVEEVCAKSGMTRDAVYAWRSRLLKQVKVIAIDLSSTKSDRMRAAEARAQ
jgi:RNA polymerase sigma-70 factor (ECF subfamily)